MLSLKSLIAAISQSSVSLVLDASNRGFGTLLQVPRVWLSMLGKDSAPSGRASWRVRARNPLFAVGSIIFRFMPFTLYDRLLDSMDRVQSVDDIAVVVFVGDANTYHSEWLESVSPTDRHGHNVLDFCSLSSCLLSQSHCW